MNKVEARIWIRGKKGCGGSNSQLILCGDDLKDVLAQENESCLFWLDAQFSAGVTTKGDKETPAENELAHILKHPLAHEHVILIDDARCFTGKGDYPSVQKLKDLTLSVGFNVFEVEDDIIRIY